MRAEITRVRPRPYCKTDAARPVSFLDVKRTLDTIAVGRVGFTIDISASRAFGTVSPGQTAGHRCEKRTRPWEGFAGSSPLLFASFQRAYNLRIPKSKTLRVVPGG